MPTYCPSSSSFELSVITHFGSRVAKHPYRSHFLRREQLHVNRTLKSRSQAMTSHGRGYETALKALESSSRLPRIIVWDLDYTLWPFWCEMYTTKDKPSLYQDARPILDACRQKGIPMAIASRTPTPHVAEAFMRKLGITDMFESIQLIPASSGYDMHGAQKDKAHLPNIRKEMGVEYRDMLFFDDEAPNITKVARLGVTSIHVPFGMSCQVFQQGLQEHANQQLGR